MHLALYCKINYIMFAVNGWFIHRQLQNNINIAVFHPSIMHNNYIIDNLHTCVCTSMSVLAALNLLHSFFVHAMAMDLLLHVHVIMIIMTFLSNRSLK